jgi:hypothetical protein
MSPSAIPGAAYSSAKARPMPLLAPVITILLGMKKSVTDE